MLFAPSTSGNNNGCAISSICVGRSIVLFILLLVFLRHVADRVFCNSMRRGATTNIGVYTTLIALFFLTSNKQ